MARDPDQVRKTKKILLECAIAVFGENGYEKAKIADIVARAGFSQRTFYIYFENKESIYRQILNEWKIGMLNVFSIEKGNRNHQMALQTRWKRIFDFMDENAAKTKVVYYLNPYIGEIRKEFLEKLKEMMDYEQNIKYIRSDVDTSFLATSVLAIMEALAMQYLIKNRLDAEFLSKQIAMFYTKGTSNANVEGDLHG
ncbi:putative HTH-type transcriptional regulator YvdT [Sporomusa ovata DSM 2662]|uniref:Transcriptional regulator, TetR family n=2 Tax=Sporomusa ovata TaxID=2378 RepID=A0A0U1KXM1_9FIRM|nr:transcriptional regulator [Sporomusa ovata DSM 2662]CQR72178.1 Transcriptional regulator, TetR family [Sporomusa ovata]